MMTGIRRGTGVQCPVLGGFINVALCREEDCTAEDGDVAGYLGSVRLGDPGGVSDRSLCKVTVAAVYITNLNRSCLFSHLIHCLSHNSKKDLSQRSQHLLASTPS